jgi:hypothetical protein
VADTILKNILPKSKIENKLHKTSRADRKPLPANTSNNNNAQQPINQKNIAPA